MRRLAEALYDLQPDQILVGQTPTLRELLKLWVHRHEEGFDLFVTSILEPGEEPGGLLRNAVGRNLVSAADVLEALHVLEEVYPVEPRIFHNLPVTLRAVTPDLLELIEEQMLRVAHSTETGEFAPDDLEATIVKVNRDGPIEIEVENDDNDDDEEDLKHLVLTDA
ncbi:hypothetical protein [Meiothermus sp. CFH 77666]|uniref:hypothetical protein n=1 Tax=Meiothermus sp. CFH 77666 TaxID=2817942 RepID=UPI001AA05054|nr:hypothetical protein [Meiothermus sp. CFH 77666]MBO1436757.1 hypothetical protein [Meiothermus sp. CFH 77666]